MNACVIFNRGKQNSQLVPGATVWAAVPKLAERRVRVQLLAAELPSLPAGGGSRGRDAEQSSTLAAVDHTGESWIIVCLSLSHIHKSTDTSPRKDAKTYKPSTPRLFKYLFAVLSLCQQFLSGRYSELPASTCNSEFSFASYGYVNQLPWHLIFLRFGNYMVRKRAVLVSCFPFFLFLTETKQFLAQVSTADYNTAPLEMLFNPCA